MRHAVGVHKQTARRAGGGQFLLDESNLGLKLNVFLEANLAHIVAVLPLIVEVLSGEHLYIICV